MKNSRRFCGWGIEPMIMNPAFTVVLFFAATVTYAAEYMPYPEAKVTKEQWQSYAEEVSREFQASERRYPDQRLTTYSDDASRMSFAFTMPGHPAHPAWITRQVVEANGSIDLRQIGYFAGEEESFAELSRQYQELTQRTRQQFQRE